LIFVALDHVTRNRIDVEGVCNVALACEILDSRVTGVEAELADL
jgi:hypothetical protein